MKLATTSKTCSTLPYIITSSSVAGATASFITNPLDLAKLRLQIGRSGQISGAPSTTASMLRHVYRKHGVVGMFRGAGARVLFHTPNTAITMTAFEECKKLLTQH